MGGSQSTPSTPQHDKAALDINANAVPVDCPMHNQNANQSQPQVCFKFHI